MILGDKLCGYIVAIRQDIPWAYMVAIEPILEDIGRKLGTDDVRLPTAVEIESHAVSEEIFTRRITQELSSKTDKHLAVELPDDLVNKKNHLLDQQEDEPLNEKPFVLDNAPYISMVQPSLLPYERPGKNNEPRESTIGLAVHASLTTTHGYIELPGRPTPLLRPDSQSIRSATVPTSDLGHDSTYFAPWTRRWNTIQATVKLYIVLSLYKMINLPYKILRCFEPLILRIEDRRRYRRARLFRSSTSLIWILGYPIYPDNHCYDIQTAMLKVIQIFWYYLSFPLLITVNILLNILYFVVCFPLIFWVVHRHRDVLDRQV